MAAANVSFVIKRREHSLGYIFKQLDLVREPDGEREQRQRAGLVRGGQRRGHVVQQRQDAQAHLWETVFVIKILL